MSVGVGRALVAAVAASTLAACVLLTDTDGFSGGAGDAGGAIDASSDAPVEASPGLDAGSDASIDAPIDAPSFRDEFARADDADLGNGWTEKSPQVFSIVGGAVVKAQSMTLYRDNIVTRPASEDRADVEVSAVFTYTAADGYPQVLARAQRSTLSVPSTYDGYIFFVDSPTRLLLARQRGDALETSLGTIEVEELQTGARVRLVLRVSGSPPVVEGIIERIEGSGATVLGSTKAMDTATERIETPGATGFSGHSGLITEIDDFEWRALGTR